jgi:hypothetical protein
MIGMFEKLEKLPKFSDWGESSNLSQVGWIELSLNSVDLLHPKCKLGHQLEVITHYYYIIIKLSFT